MELRDDVCIIFFFFFYLPQRKMRLQLLREQRVRSFFSYRSEKMQIFLSVWPLEMYTSCGKLCIRICAAKTIFAQTNIFILLKAHNNIKTRNDISVPIDSLIDRSWDHACHRSLSIKRCTTFCVTRSRNRSRHGYKIKK